MQEIKLNKNMNIMQDEVFLGLNTRQFLFSAVGLALGAAVYFAAIKRGLPSDLAVIFTALVASPFAALGFVKYHGLTFEELVVRIIAQTFLTEQQLVPRLENIFYAQDKKKINALEELEAMLNV